MIPALGFMVLLAVLGGCAKKSVMWWTDPATGARCYAPMPEAEPVTCVDPKK